MSSSNLVGKTVGTCILERLIGQGGMGAVYLARQIRPSRYVAVKILLPNVTTDSQLYREFLARFRREADVIARLDHINIVPIHEYGEQEGLAYLVMPYLPGGSLRDILARNGTLSLQEAASFIEQAASALDYAHAHGVIHRDLKPGNFLLHTDGRLVLADFGIARIIQETDSTFRATLTGTGMLLGTPEYMAPEMINGEPIDHRVDIYALGIILFQMLSGKVPFQGNTPFAVATKHLQEPPPFLHQAYPTIPAEVDTVIQKALAKKREDRYTSAGALAQTLRNVLLTPGFLSQTQLRNAPTVISPARPTPPPPVSVSQTVDVSPKTPAPTLLSGTSEPTRLRSEPSSGGFPHSGLTQPVTPYPALPPANRQQPWLIFIGILLVLLLVLGGVLVGLQLNKGTTTSSTGPLTTANTPSSSNPTVGTHTTPTTSSSGSTSTSQPTATSAPTQPVSAGIPKGAVLYFATSPGRPCDSSGGHWANYNNPTITCQGSGTTIGNPYSQSPDLVGTLLTSMPNQAFPSNYVIEVQLQPIGASSADFGIYFRNQPGNAEGVYTFFIHPDGTWRAYVYDNVTGAASPIAQGSLGGTFGGGTVDVVAEGSNFSFYINGQLVGRANDSTYPTGTVGIALDAGGTIFASNFRLYSLATH